MIQQATNDGDKESAEAFSTVKEELKKSSTRHYYAVNGKGRYLSYQVIEKYIKFKLDGGTPFDKGTIYLLAIEPPLYPI